MRDDTSSNSPHFPRTRIPAGAPVDSPHALQLERGFAGLRFDAPLEREFRTQFRAESLPQIRRNLWIALIIVVGFSLMTHLVLEPEVNRLMNEIRLAMFGPILIFGLVLHKTRFGRYLYAIGNNEAASRYSGVPVDRVKLAIFVLSSVMAALAGFILAARFGSTRPDIGNGLELTVITVAVLGGVSIFGGSGTMIGAVLALILVGILRFGMSLVNLQGQVQSIVIGLLLILSILLPRLGGRFSARWSWDAGLARKTAVAVAIAVAFGVFFFWSRSLILTQ